MRREETENKTRKEGEERGGEERREKREREVEFSLTILTSGGIERGYSKPKAELTKIKRPVYVEMTIECVGKPNSSLRLFTLRSNKGKTILVNERR
jgi:hypothetical protein